MALKDLQKLKKTVTAPTQKRFYRHLIVGNDLFSLATYQLLVEKFGETEVGLLAKREVTREDLQFKGPNSLRGEANIAHFKKLYPHVELEFSEQEPCFYKEQKFRKFGGRSKPETLLWGEEYYVGRSAQFDLEQVFSFLKDEEFLTKVSDRLEIHLPKAIVMATPEDLVENAHWSIECTDGLQLNCEKLYWGDSPSEFLELTRNKSELSSELIEYCGDTKTPSSLFIKFQFEKPLTDMDKTVFLPLSYTHEWGHFIGEFHGDESREVEFVSFLVPEQTNEEDISKKIRILKRNLEKIFYEYKQNNPKEFITLEDNSPCLKIDDSLYDNVRDAVKNLNFISINGPIESFQEEENSFEYSRSDLSHMARGLTNLEQIKTNLV